TTLISILTCNSRPTTGTALVQGHDTVNEANEVKKSIGYVPQENFSCSILTGRENLVYFARLFGFPRGEAEALASELLKTMELQGDSGKRVSEYSGGMRKRLEVATALLPGADVLFLDEPTTGLDPSARKDFLRILTEVNSEGVTVFMVTHIGEDAEAASRVGFMDGGRIVLEDDPEKLRNGSGLRNVIEVETPRKGEDVEDILMAFSSDRELQETDEGYKVFCEDPEEALPAIVRALDGIGCQARRLETRAPSLEDVFFKVTRKPLRS
ncbi:ABC transporter ATP-binding protein, partial [Candidatus Bathyarchaeota archaeon]|nr:ABC transporter ATP-binding protein [Candidatus Bathyarchaeota archaeon]